MDTPAAACRICSRELYADDAYYQACQPCTLRTDQNLRALAGRLAFEGKGSDRKIVAGLYSALPHAMAPGSGSSGGRVSGSRETPIGIKLEPLSLSARGGLVTVLQTWVDDWAGYGYAARDYSGTLQQQVDRAVATLRFNLNTAARCHEAFPEFAAEMGSLRGQCERMVTGEKPPRKIGATCPCGTRLTFTLDTKSRRCRGCHTDHGHAELIELAKAESRIAA
jgi:hypothetical protein